MKKGTVVVITGASTGIGRAAAQEFARRGANLVLAARNGKVLQDVARECGRLGGRAEIVPTDVGDPAAVERLCQAALASFGRVDVWINNAAVAVMGRFTEVPVEEHRRVMEVNFLGYLYGSHSAMRVFERQGAGVLINNASMGAHVPVPRVPAYIASKHAILGFSRSLRQELFLDGRRAIRVCVVMPSSIDTPAFQHAANRLGFAPRLRGPIIPSRQVARAMVGLVDHPRDEVFVGHTGRIVSLSHALLRTPVERLIAWGMNRFFLDRRKPVAAREGNLFRPRSGDGWETSGGWKSDPESAQRSAAA